MSRTRMSKIAAKIFAIGFVALSFVFSIGLFSSSAFAVENGYGDVFRGIVEPTYQCVGDDCGSGGGDYSTSWIYYESLLNEGDGEYPIEFRPDITANNWPQSSKNLSIPAECSKTIGDKKGGFWHFGRNYKAYSNNGYAIFGNFMYVHGYSAQYPYSDYTYSSSNGSYGHSFTYSWGLGKRYLSVPNGTLDHVLYYGDIPVYRAVRFDGAPAPNDENRTDSAWYAFLRAYEWEHNGYSYDRADSYEYPSDVWGFCWASWMEQEYFTSSKVKVDAGNGDVEEAETGPSAVWAEADVPSDYKKGGAKKVGDKVKVTISHNIYTSSEETEPVAWQVVDKRITASNGLKYTYSVSQSESGSESSSSALRTKSGEYYTRDSNGYVSQNTYDITFQSKGTITICETIELPNKGRRTGACATIEGGNEVSYYAKSNVAISGGKQDKNYVTTGVTSHGEQSVAESNLKKNDKRYIYFSHNVYSSKKVEDVPVTINRTGFDGANYTLVSSQTTCYNGWNGKVKFENEDYADGKNLYIGDPRGCSDGTYNYLVRDVYEVQFTAEKKTYNFCEELTIEGAKTKVCARIETGYETPPPGPGPTPTPCDPWRPTSYDQSWGEAAWTSVVAKVKNTTLGESWDDDTYAKPTDNVDWIFCYYPGVQKAYQTLATTNHVSEGPGYPDNSYSLSYTTLSNGFFGTWQNMFSLSALGNFSPGWSPWTYTFAFGNSSMVDVYRAYNVERGAPNNKAGDTLTGQITSGIPTYAGVSHHGSHSWPCHWQCNSGVCGTHCCGWTTTCVTDDKGNKTCSTVCSATCCNSCYVDTCSHAEDYISNSRSNNSAVDNASVNIPYNFRNTSKVSITESLVYAGETATINLFDVQVNTRYNSRTSGSYGAYATQVDDAKIKLVAYASTSNTASAKDGVGSGKSYNICNSISGAESCMEIDSDDGLLMNSPGNMGGITEHYASTFNSDYSVFDTDAGKYFCVVAAVYPANSGGDLNLVASGSNSWYVSEPSCRIIAKRPSFQVRGGTVYSSDTISTSTSNKNNVRNNILAYTSTNSGTTVVFGSWGEQGVFSNGIVKGFASGAATGMTGSVEGYNPEYCIFRVPISFANFFPSSQPMCPNAEQIGGLASDSRKSGDSGIDTTTVNKKALVDYWWVANPVEVNVTDAYLGNFGNYVETQSLQKDDVRFTYKNGDLNLVSSVINSGITHVVRATGTITIKGNVTYNDLESYTALQYVPKLIIYGQRGININCNVTRIDALLISDGTVNTCADASSDVNDQKRSNQLVINGVIAANKLVLGRTYGAGAGRASAIPAEVLNYDTSAILWGRRTAESDEFETMTTVYQQELAPRY